jgi:hypothetical protein
MALAILPITSPIGAMLSPCFVTSPSALLNTAPSGASCYMPLVIL